MTVISGITVIELKVSGTKLIRKKFHQVYPKNIIIVIVPLRRDVANNVTMTNYF